MKTFGVLHILLILILVVAYQCSSAQDYLVTSRGDSLNGEIKPLTYGADQKVQLTDENKKKTVYPFFQIRSYTLKGEIYQPVKGPNGYVFMKLIKPGYLSLYAFQMENQVTYDGLYLVKKDGTGTEVPNLGFKKALKKFLSDCPNVESKIENGDLTKKQLDRIVDEYNGCIEGHTVNHEKVVAQKVAKDKKIDAWDVLEEKVKNQQDFSAKSDALEMIGEIRNKISKSEKVPNFLIEGLKKSLQEIGLEKDVDSALKEVD